MFENAKWIWCKDSGEQGTCLFRYAFECDKRPKSATLTVAATDRCFVQLNGEYVLFAGGKTPTDTEVVYDTVEVADTVKKGVNVLVVRVKARADRNAVAVECPELGVYSSDRFLAYCSSAATDDGETYVYNATKEHRLGGIHAPEFISDLFVGAVPANMPSTDDGDEPTPKAVLPRAVPVVTFDASKKRPYKKVDGGIVMETVSGAAYPRFVVTANSGDRITVTGSLSKRKLEYVACAGEQSFEFDEPLYGTLTFAAVGTVKWNDVCYRSVTCGAKSVGSFTCDCDAFNALYTYALNTFRTTCVGLPTDYAGGETLSALDACAAVRNALYLYAEGPAYAETVLTATLDAIEGNPSFVDVGNKAHTLLALGTAGVAADCFGAVNNADLKGRYLTVAADYLQKIDLDDLGMLVKGDVDTRYNCDSELAAKSLYYAAVSLCRRVADDIGVDRYNDFFDARKEEIAKTADSLLRGNGLSLDKNFHDDRANALAVLTELAPQFMAGDAARVMASALNASPMFEGYIAEALFGVRGDWAQIRLQARLSEIRLCGGDTVPEDYIGEGAGARAASAGILGALFRGLVGIRHTDGGRTVTVMPELKTVSNVACTVPAVGGEIVCRFTRNKSGAAECFVDNRSDANVILRLKATRGFATDEPIKVLELKKGKNTFKF